MHTLSMRSKKSLSGVHPSLVTVVEEAIKITSQDFTVTEGLRDYSQQLKNVASGASKTMNSKHLVQPDGYGWAVDLYPYYNGSVQVNAPMSVFKTVADAMQAAADKLGVCIARGYDWGWDAPHYELAVPSSSVSAPPASSSAASPRDVADFNVAYHPLKGFESGWCDVVGDAGGETVDGIARNYFSDWEGWCIVDAEKTDPSFKQGAGAFSKHLRSIPELNMLVEEWFKKEWWDRMGLARFPQYVANELFEQAVNLGRGGSGKLVQTVCNALNWKRGPNGEDTLLFPDLAVDGVLGAKSLDAIATILRERCTPEVLTHQLNCMQGWHYNNLAASSVSRRKFMLGWEKRTYDEWVLYPTK